MTVRQCSDTALSPPLNEPFCPQVQGVSDATIFQVPGEYHVCQEPGSELSLCTPAELLH